MFFDLRIGLLRWVQKLLQKAERSFMQEFLQDFKV
jgi:hypothetical protein